MVMPIRKIFQDRQKYLLSFIFSTTCLMASSSARFSFNVSVARRFFLLLSVAASFVTFKRFFQHCHHHSPPIRGNITFSNSLYFCSRASSALDFSSYLDTVLTNFLEQSLSLALRHCLVSFNASLSRLAASRLDWVFISSTSRSCTTVLAAWKITRALVISVAQKNKACISILFYSTIK